MPEDPPNILLITTDQQRYDAAGNHGPSFLRTPHYNMLQRQGVTFSSAYASKPLCVPARTSIMTGKTAQVHGMDSGNRTTYDYMGHEETLAGRLNAAGYHTALIGKAHFSPGNVRHGFQEMITRHQYYRDTDPHQRNHGLGGNEIFPARSSVPESETETAWIADQCEEFIRHRLDETRPSFLWCSFFNPHPPLDPPEPYYSMYDDSNIPDPIESDWSGDNLPPLLQDNTHSLCSIEDPETLRKARACYYGLITQVDYNMGRVMGALRDRGLFDETLVIYTSDHGEFLGDHGLQWKTHFMEPSSHVPFVIRPPHSWEGFDRGGTVNAPVQLADILPTCVRAGEGDVPTDCNGEDLLPVARGASVTRDYAEGISTMLTGSDYIALVDDRWKFIYYPDGPAELLFDLEEDPNETTNLAHDDEYAEKRKEMKTALVAQQRERDSPFIEDGELAAYPAGERSDDHWANADNPLTWEGF